MKSVNYKRLEIIGITYNQIEKGVYALILQEVHGVRRIPIAIGTAEAQSIECKLQEIITPRPLTHDLMANILRAFGINLRAIIIKQLPGGIFAADLLISDGERSLELDSRSSDAIALALRMNVPIMIDEALLDKIGFVRDRTGATQRKDSTSASVEKGTEKGEEQSIRKISKQEQIKWMTEEELTELLANAVAKEDYKYAALIKKELDSRNKADDVK